MTYKRFLAAVATAAVLGMARPAGAAWTSPNNTIGIFDRFTYDGTILDAKAVYLVDRIRHRTSIKNPVDRISSICQNEIAS